MARTKTRRTRADQTGDKPTGTKKTARTRREPAARLSLVKDTPTVQATVVDLRRPLPARHARHRNFTGPHTKAQMTEARACLASAMAALPVPHLLWLTQIDGHAAARLTDGTLLVHTHERAPEFTAYLRCPTGGLHTELVTNTRDLNAARAITGTCNRRHDDTNGDSPYDWHNAATRGIQKLIPARLSPLTTGLQAVKKTTAKTQPLDLDQIAEGLAARATPDTEPAKEHPQP
ncbi:MULTISPECIES: hypothetical protein [unclassified Streptomyces]|uniref:hypothetical protein n=1 Tax=unclassified Streptomyces TaxID=2593676 RepID=UPI0036DFDA96